MDTPQPESYRTQHPNGREALPDVREAANRRRDHGFGPENYSKELGLTELEIEAALEALRVEGEVLS